MNITDAIINYEQGELDEEDTITLFQELVDTGLAWTLQGSYGRQAQWLIEAGLIEAPGREVKPELSGTRCECGAPYDEVRGGYRCAFR